MPPMDPFDSGEKVLVTYRLPCVKLNVRSVFLVFKTSISLTWLGVCALVQLIEFLSDQNELAAADVLVFVREAIQRFEQLRPVIIGKLLDTFPSIKSLK